MADRRSLPVLAAILTAATLAACGSTSSGRDRGTAKVQKPGKQTPEQVVYLYSSLPLSGPQAKQGIAIQQGIRTGLAVLEQPASHVGDYRIVYRSLNDATRHGWSPTLAAGNAEKAAINPNTGLYIGELDSGATEAALPILNQAGIVELTPGSSYIGLTDSVRSGVTAPDEPERFYPNPKLRNLLRLVPNEMVQVAAIMDAMEKVGPCVRVAAVSFGGTADAASEVLATQVTAPEYGMTYVSIKAPPTEASAADLATYVQALRAQTVGCLVLAGRSTATTTALVRLVRADLPHDPVFGTSGYCEAERSVPGSYCASPVMPLSEYSGGSTYTRDYRHSISATAQPSPYGVYGFIAAEVAVNAIDELLGESVDVRTQLQRALLGGDVVQTSAMIGAVEFDSRGNLSSDRRIGIYRADPRGQMQYVTTVSPTRVVGDE